MINIYKLTDKETNLFLNIHERCIPKRTKRMETLSIISQKGTLKLDQTKQYELISPILNKAINILTQNNISNFDTNEYLIEFHQRNCGFEKKPYQHFSWHQDNYGPVSYKVHTILFYLRKDITIIGGNLDYKIHDKAHNTHIKRHHIKEGDIVQFDGSLYHRPEETRGFGCRDIIVVFIKQTNIHNK